MLQDILLTAAAAAGGAANNAEALTKMGFSHMMNEMMADPGEFFVSWVVFLMLVILCVSTGSKEKGAMAGIAVGALIALEAMFANPTGIYCSNDGRIYVADSYRIRMIHNGQVTTIAGSDKSGFKDGKASKAKGGTRSPAA